MLDWEGVSGLDGRSDQEEIVHTISGGAEGGGTGLEGVAVACLALVEHMSFESRVAFSRKITTAGEK